MAVLEYIVLIIVPVRIILMSGVRYAARCYIKSVKSVLRARAARARCVGCSN
jgi:hypothetical protein